VTQIVKSAPDAWTGPDCFAAICDLIAPVIDNDVLADNARDGEIERIGTHSIELLVLETVTTCSIGREGWVPAVRGALMLDR